MINLFEFAPNDLSLDYLSQLFGYMNGVIPLPSGAPSGTSITILSTMFRTFNSAILAVAALVIVYVVVVGVIKTATEGEFLGRQWNKVFVPLRLVFGIAALVPTGSGYCAIQLLMMWVIVQGVGAADTLWNTTLGFVQLAGSPFAQVTIPSVDVNQAMSGLFQGLTCDATFRLKYANPMKDATTGGYYCNSNQPFCKTNPAFRPNTSVYQMGPGGLCGTLTYCNRAVVCANANSIACKACEGQLAALQDIIPTLGAIASQLATVDYNYRSFYYTSFNQPNDPNWSFVYSYCSAQNPPIGQKQCCIPAGTSASLRALGIQIEQTCQAGGSGFPKPDRDGISPGTQSPSQQAVLNIYLPYGLESTIKGTDFVDAAVGYYVNSVTEKVTEFIASQGQDTQALQGRLRDAQRTGWVLAGAYYYSIAQMNNNNFKNAIPALVLQAPRFPNNQLAFYRNNISAAGDIISQQAAADSAVASMPELAGPMGAAFQNVSHAFVSATASGNAKTRGTNPLVAVQATGYALLFVALILFRIFFNITIALGIVSNIAVTVLGTGPTLNPVGAGLVLGYMVLVPMMYGFLALLIGMGGMLGVYVPLIPYVLFTFGALGWFISTIEAMVAGPLVALGILVPGGQHDILGKSEPALMLLFNIFLRPSLMIFGLIGALLLSSVAIIMLNAAFGVVITSIADLGGQGKAAGAAALAANPLQTLLFFVAYIFLIVTLLHKSFALIHIIPENVMRWIGGQGERYGEAEALGETKGAVERGTGGIKGGAEAGRGAAQQFVKQHGEESAKQPKKEGPGLQTGKSEGGEGGKVGKGSGGAGSGPTKGAGGKGG